MTTDHDKALPLADEYLQAVAKMTPREQAVFTAILDLGDAVIDAVDLLIPLTDEAAAGYDPAHALIAAEVIRILHEAGYTAHARQTSIVGAILGAVVH